MSRFFKELNKFMLIDTHAHVNFAAYKDDWKEIVEKCLASDTGIINVGSQLSTSRRALDLAQKFEKHVWAAVGIHPVHLKAGKFVHHDIDEVAEVEFETRGEDFVWENYFQLAQDEKVVAIGEVGLDYHHFQEGNDIQALKKKQKEILLEFIKLANEVQKPVMLHCWDGYDDLLEILQKNPVLKKGVVHSFIGSHKTARKFIELGYKISLNGIATYGDSYNRLISEIDLKDILLETDCPYLTPRPLERQMRNEPLFVKYVAEKIAQVKKVSVEEVEKNTTQNAREVFGI